MIYLRTLNGGTWTAAEERAERLYPAQPESTPEPEPEHQAEIQIEIEPEIEVEPESSYVSEPEPEIEIETMPNPESSSEPDDFTTPSVSLTIGIRMQKHMLDDLDRVAKRYHRTRSSQIRFLIEECIDEFKAR